MWLLIIFLEIFNALFFQFQECSSRLHSSLYRIRKCTEVKFYKKNMVSYFDFGWILCITSALRIVLCPVFVTKLHKHVKYWVISQGACNHFTITLWRNDQDLDWNYWLIFQKLVQLIFTQLIRRGMMITICLVQIYWYLRRKSLVLRNTAFSFKQHS